MTEPSPDNSEVFTQTLFARCQWCPICREGLVLTGSGKQCPHGHGTFWPSANLSLEFVANKPAYDGPISPPEKGVGRATKKVKDAG